MNNLSTRFILFLNLTISMMFASLVSSGQQYMRTNLFIVNPDATRTLMDGNITIYDNVYCDCVDYDDGWKMTNPGLNWGVIRSATTLVVERRRVIGITDTSYIRMWNMPVKPYVIQVITKSMNRPGLVGYVNDKFTGTKTPIGLNDTNYISFDVTATAGSYSQDRFSVIFENNALGPLPISFTGIQAYRKNSDVSVNWSVENELTVEAYSLQHSDNGTTFNDIETVSALNSGTEHTYESAVPKNNNKINYYRVKAIEADGKFYYSNIAKIAGAGAGMELNVYPVPLTGRTLQVQLSVETAGAYQVNVISAYGTVYPVKEIQASAAQSSHSIQLPVALSAGVYKLQFIGPGNVNYYRTITIL